MTIDTAYSLWAARYDSDRNLTRDLDRTVTASVLGAFCPGLTIEAGCGTGKNTPFLASISGAVVALDFSDGMLARARDRVQEPTVQFRQADLTREWPSEHASADLVTCSLVLEHIHDIEHVFREAARSLAAGGHCFVCELHPTRQYQGGQAHFVDDAGDTITIPAYTHHVSEFVRAAHSAGFTLVRLDEWWHDDDSGKPPRLLSLLLRR